ncbi:hypothetical protein MASR2M52_01840 [Pedobacter sp.]
MPSIQSTVYPKNRLPFNQWQIYIRQQLAPKTNEVKLGGLWHKDKQQEVLNAFKDLLK